MKYYTLLLIVFSVSLGVALAEITFTGDVSVDFDENSTFVGDYNGTGDVYVPSGISATGWDIYAVYLHYDRALDQLYVGFDFNGLIAGDADADGDPSNTGYWLDQYGGEDVPDLGQDETICCYFNTNLSGGYEVISGVPRNGDVTDFAVANCDGNPNSNPSSSFGSAIASASGSQYYLSPDEDHPDFEFFIDNFSELPGFNFDIESEDCVFKFGAYAGSFADANIGKDILRSSSVTVTFFNQTTIPHGVPRDLYVMQGIPLFVDDGDPEVLFGDDLNNVPIGWPDWRVSRWNVELQTYERWEEEPNWPINVGGNPPEQDPGKSFWFVQDVMDDCQLDITGQQLEPGYVVFLDVAKPMTGSRRGLNQFANPFHLPITWEDTYFKNSPYQSGGNAYSIEDMVDDEYVCRYAVTWDPYNLEYITSDLDAAIDPWAGFWFEQYRDDQDYCIVWPFPADGADNGNKKHIVGGGVPKEIDEYGEWSFNIGVYSETYDLTDFGNYIGISEETSDEFDQFDAHEFAPQFAPDGYYHLYFPHYDWSEHPGAYCYDFREGPFEGTREWDMVVRADGWSGTLIMAWDGVFKSHPEYQVSLLDAAGSTLVEDLLETESYTFSINDGDEIDFTLLVTGFGVGVEEPGIESPEKYELSDAYPNPFNDRARLNFKLPNSGSVLMQVYDVSGRLVSVLADGEYSAGEHAISFDADGLSSGVYFIRASADGKVFGTQKVMLLK